MSEANAPIGKILAEHLLPALRVAQADTILYPGEQQPTPVVEELHPWWELCFIFEGTCPFSLAGKQIHLKSGSLVLIPPQCPHSEINAGPKSPYAMLWLSLAWPEAINLFLSRYTPTEGFQIISGCQVQPHIEVQTLLVQALAQVRNQALLHVEAAAALLTLLFIEIFRMTTVLAPESSSQWQGKIAQQVKDYLANHLAEHLSLEEIAGKIGFSPNYLCAIFRQATGQTIFGYLSRLRLEQAQLLLAGTELPISIIAARVGYNSQFAFSRFFRKALGQSPSAYRLAARQGR